MNSIYLNGFSLSILVDNEPVEKIIYRNANYYEMPNQSIYTLELTNDNNVRTDAHVWINEKKIGIWRINPYSTISIKTHKTGERFILFKDDDRDVNYGLIRIEYRPEKPGSSTYTPPIISKKETDPTFANYLCKDYTDTVTPANKIHRSCAMNTDSYDRYVENMLMPQLRKPEKLRTVESIDNVDIANITNIYTRLVINNDKTTTSRQYNLIRQVKNYEHETPIPSKLGLMNPSRPHSISKDSNFTLSKQYNYSNF